MFHEFSITRNLPKNERNFRLVLLRVPMDSQRNFDWEVSFGWLYDEFLLEIQNWSIRSWLFCLEYRLINEELFDGGNYPINPDQELEQMRKIHSSDEGCCFLEVLKSRKKKDPNSNHIIRLPNVYLIETIQSSAQIIK